MLSRDYYAILTEHLHCVKTIHSKFRPKGHLLQKPPHPVLCRCSSLFVSVLFLALFDIRDQIIHQPLFLLVHAAQYDLLLGFKP